MGSIMTNKEFVAKIKEVERLKTLYIMGCFGAPMTEKNKARYCQNSRYNKEAERTAKISAADADTFGFDCVGLIKGVLWGFAGKKDRTYGGAAYAANGVSDLGANAMIAKCSELSSNFSRIEVGEAVWMEGHIGVYIGDGLAIECTPIWKDGVQITACNCTKSGYHRRNWTKHGKLPYIAYTAASVPTVKPTTSVSAVVTVKEWQLAAIADGFKLPKYGADGVWGAECEAVARKAVCKKRIRYAYKNLTKLVQRAVGVKADGLYGAATAAAVKSWQKSKGLVADGCVGINSWKTMLGV